MSCDFCPKTQRRPDFMNIQTFSKVLDQIKLYTDYIYLHVKGEPLLHPDLDKFLDISYEKGFKVNLTTNGTLIHKMKDKLLLKPALRQVNFSLHSFEDDGWGQTKEEYIGKILSFTKEAVANSDILISLRLWNLDENNLINMKRQRNNEILSAIEKEFQLDYHIQELVLPGKGIKISDRVYLNQDHLFQWPDLKEKEDTGAGFCYGLRHQIAILVDTTVVPCCLDGEGIINLGDLSTTDFKDIIESKRAFRILEGFSRREVVEELCRKCGYRKRFGL